MTDKKWTEIDGLRALAVFGVMLAHWAPEWIKIFNPGGSGVRLFFVISGFLITGILLRSRARIDDGASVRGELTTFYWRRTWRIFPPYYAILGIGLVAALVGAPFIQGLPWHLAYLSNAFIFLVDRWPDPGGHFWSLAVEEQFYLIWPAMIFLAPRRAILPLILTAIACAPIFRTALYLDGFSLLRQVAIPLPSCLDDLGIGALLAWLHAERRLKPAHIAAAGIVGVVGWLATQVARALGVEAAGLGVNLFVGLTGFSAIGAIALGQTRRLQWLNFAPLQHLGRISYGLYLYHPFVALAVDKVTRHSLSVWPRLVVCVLATIVVAEISWLLIERPLLSLKDSLPYGAARPKPAAPQKITA